MLLFSTKIIYAQEFTSLSYKVLDPVMNAGGYSTSDNFQLNGVISQISIATSTSSTFGINAGFLYFPVATTPVVPAVLVSSGSGSGGGWSGIGVSDYLKPVSLKVDLFEILKKILPVSVQERIGLAVKPVTIPIETPLVYQGKWNLFAPLPTVKKFVLTPLPKELIAFTKKFPHLEQILTEAGVTKMSHLPKLRYTKFNLPGISQLTQRPLIAPPAIGARPALPPAIPVAKLLASAIKKIPTEIVFARSPNEKIDMNIVLSLTDKGELKQTLNTVTGQLIKLVVKANFPVKKVTGYMILNNQLAQKQFKYNYVGNNIYETTIQAPLVSNQYEIRTIIEYLNPDLPIKEIKLIVVVDPHGYVFEKIGDQELKIKDAEMTLNWLNPKTDSYQPWPAEEYQQNNPQVTDKTGRYSFLVPAGKYYLSVTAPHYKPYKSGSFVITVGNNIHNNIELKNRNILKR